MWNVRHVYPVWYLGWFVIVLKRHVESLAACTEEELAELGTLQARMLYVLQRALVPQKVYMGCFHEHPGFNHVHLHMIAKPAMLPTCCTGSKIFSTLSQVTVEDSAPPEQIRIICASVRRRLEDPITTHRRNHMIAAATTTLTARMLEVLAQRTALDRLALSAELGVLPNEAEAALATLMLEGAVRPSEDIKYAHLVPMDRPFRIVPAAIHR